MGWFDSSEEVSSESKTVDSNGQVNNNIIIQEAKDIHHQSQTNEYIMMATFFLCGVEIVKLIIYFYNGFINNMKKKYQPKQTSNRASSA